MHNRIKRLKGQGITEYALILVVVAVASIVVLSLFGEQIQFIFCDVALAIGAEGIEVCETPHITCAGVGPTASGPINMEAIVKDNDGYDGIQVKFYVDGTHVRTEKHYRYCLGGSDATCSDYNMPPGDHTIEAVVTDKDGYENRCSVDVTVN